MKLKLNTWYIQEVRDVQPGSAAARSMVPQTFGYQPIRFTWRKRNPQMGEIHLTLDEARKACGAPNAELL